MNSKGLRILLLAPGTNPNSITGPLIGYRLGEALSRLHTVTMVIEGRDEAAVRSAKGDFHALEVIHLPLMDRFYGWVLRRIFKENRGSLLWTAIRYPQTIIFEWCAWKRLRGRIFAGEFDVVLRILPIDPTFASPFAFFLRKGPVPFVIGPLNGGVPWPKGFSQLDREKAAGGNWVAKLRGFYRFLPFARSTYAKAAAIIAGSTQTCREFAQYSDKVFYVPGENGVSSSLIEETSDSKDKQRLELTYAGRLVPFKACDLALRGAASILRNSQAHLTIIGDGPERRRFEELAGQLGISDAVTFCGWVKHQDTLSRFRKADVLVFPSLREFGGGVVFEAIAMGAVPVVADYGGPGDIVTDEVGYRIPITNETQMTQDIESVLSHLASDRNHLETLRRQGVAYARDHLTWEAKARLISKVLLWVVRAGPKPAMPPPKPLNVN
jgi:glycosyltransferase involved in cell wall biosynthesis